MKKKHLILLITTFISINIFATEQIPDNLIYKGKTYDWAGPSPAFKYFEDNNFQVPKEAIQTTANWSYYIMTYTIENNSLFLTDVEILIEKESIYGKDFPPDLTEKSVFKHFFPNKEKVLMSFYSNIQQIPFGKVIEVTKNDWTDIHNRKYLIFEIRNGKIITDYRLNYKGLKKLKSKLFNDFKQTKEYQFAVENESQNFEYFNEYRPDKYTMDEYLEYIILRLVYKLK